MFERHKDDPFYTDYFKRSKEKILPNSSKYMYDIGKIHLPISGNIGEDLHNFIHESIHYFLSESSLFIQAGDLLQTLDFIDYFTEDLNLLSHSAKQDQIDFVFDLLSGDSPFTCKRYKELSLVYFTCAKLFERSKLLYKNSIICNEGAATYCALHIQEFGENSVFDFLYNTVIPKKYMDILYAVQKS